MFLVASVALWFIDERVFVVVAADVQSGARQNAQNKRNNKQQATSLDGRNFVFYANRAPAPTRARARARQLKGLQLLHVRARHRFGRNSAVAQNVDRSDKLDRVYICAFKLRNCAAMLKVTWCVDCVLICKLCCNAHSTLLRFSLHFDSA